MSDEVVKVGNDLPDYESLDWINPKIWFSRMSKEDYVRKNMEKGLSANSGFEIPDPTPMAPPIGYKRQPSLAEQIREMVRSEKLAQEAAAAGAETFEEADDFDVEDDEFPASPYEMSDLEPRPQPVAPPVASPLPAGAAQPATASQNAAAEGGALPQPGASPVAGTVPST